jgi:translocation and assembly module TamB
MAKKTKISVKKHGLAARIAVWSGGTVLALLTVLTLALVVLFRTETGRSAIINLAKDGAEQQGFALEIGSLDGALPFEILLADVHLSDDDGEVLSLGGAAVLVDGFGLLEGHVALESIVLRQLDVRRIPNPGANVSSPTEPTPTEESGLPPLPFSVRALSIAPLSLGPAVLGEAIILEIAANTRIDPKTGIDAGFSVKRLDGDGRIEGKLESNVDLSHLKASIRGETATGGLISRLIGLPGAPGVTVTLEGDGPVESFVARYTIAAGTLAGTKGEIRLSSRQPLALTIDGTARVAAFVPPDLRPLIGESIKYGLAASLDASNTTLDVNNIQVNAAVASASGAIEVRLDDLVVDGRLSAKLTRPDLLAMLVPGFTSEGGGADISIAGPTSELGANAKIWIDGAALEERRATRIEVAVTSTLADAIESAVNVTVTGLDLPQVPKGAIGDAITASAKGTLSGQSFALSRIKLRSGPVQLTGDATLDLETSAADITLGLSHDAVGGIAPILDRGQLNAEMLGRFDGQFLALQIGARLDDIAMGDPNLARLTNGSGDLWLAVDQVSATDWRISELEIDSGRLRLNAEGSVDAATSTGDVVVTVTIPSLANVDPTQSISGGTAMLAAAIQGGGDLAEIDWRLTLSELAANRISVPNLQGVGALKVTGATIAGDLRVDAETSLGRIGLTTEAGWNGSSLNLSGLRLERGRDILSGDIDFRPDPMGIDGGLNISVSDMKDWAALVDLDLQGALATSITLSQEQGQQHVGLEGEVTGIRLDAGTATVDRVAFTAALEDAFGGPIVEGKLDLTGATTGEANAETLSLTAAGPLTALRLGLQGNGEIKNHPLRIDAASTLGLGEAQVITLERLAVITDAGQVNLQRPARIKISGEGAELEALSLAIFDGEFAASGRMERNQVSGSFSMERISLAPISDLAGLEISAGQLNAKASVSGTLESPSGAVDLVLDGVESRGEDGMEDLSLGLEVSARMDAGALDAKALLTGLGTSPLQVTLKSRIPAPGATVPIDAQALWRGDLGTLTAALPLDGNTIDGDAGVDLSIKGNFDRTTRKFNPTQTSGALTINQGRFENFMIGTVLDPIQLDVALDGTRLVIRKFEGSDTEVGTIKITGTIDLAEPAEPDVNLDVNMDAMTLVRRDDAAVQLDARITARSVVDRVKLAGVVTNRNIEIRLIGNLPSGVEELDVEEIGAGSPVAEENTDAPATDAGPPIDLDIDIAAPDRIFVRGRGLESEWGAVIKISGTALEPILSGTVAPVRGDFEFAGKRFTLGKGGVTLAGDLKADPQLGLSAIHAGTDFTASVNVGGTAGKPRISLSSDPSYPEDEILALILFGRSKAKLSAVEVLQLAQSTRNLLSGEAGTLDTVRKTIGVDVLTFTSGEGEDDVGRLKAGKYLRDDVYVGVEQGTGPGSSRSVIEWNMTPTVTVEGTVGSASQSTLGIQRRWEY